MEEEKYTVEITESEAWVIEIALKEYSERPINKEHEKLAVEVYERLKTLMLKRSEERFFESRSCTCSAYQIENYGHKCGK